MVATTDIRMESARTALVAILPPGRAGSAAAFWGSTSPDGGADRGRLSRARRGGDNNRAGVAAEDAVARRYVREGGAVIARRWRGPEGEIDLVVRERDMLVFVEVKRRRRPIVDDPVGEAQWRRLEATALRYMLGAETGDAPMRFDFALVGADGAVEVTRNARC